MTPLEPLLQPMLDAHPNLPYGWSAAGDELCFNKVGPDGFDIAIAMDSHCLYLRTEFGLEDHWHNRDETALKANLKELLGLVRDLLSPAMRLRVLYANGEPYRWLLEREVGAGWQPEATFGPLFWNYFGRRSEATFSNHCLPRRGFPD